MTEILVNRLAATRGAAITLSILAASCRDFATNPFNPSAGTAGSPVTSSSGGGPGNEGFEPKPDASSSAGGAGGVQVSAGASGELAGADGGENPNGSRSEPAETSAFGAVRLLIDDNAVCGGTLLNNNWVLTADSCLSPENPQVRIAYGADTLNPDQVRQVKEVVRFPGNNGTAEQRGRDLLLLGVDEPFRIRGTNSGFFRPLWIVPNWLQSGSQQCVGWDLTPDAPSDGRFQRQAFLTPWALVLDAKVGAREAGDWIWWRRQLLPNYSTPSRPTQKDLGSGCMVDFNFTSFLMSVNTGVPKTTHDLRVNDDIEARSIGVAEDDVRRWAGSNMLSKPDYLPVPKLGPVTAAWGDEATLQLLGVSRESGSLLWLTRREGVWGEPEDLGTPEGVTLSATLRPGSVWQPSGEINVLAVDLDGYVWRKGRSADGQWSDWSEVDAPSIVTSGIRIASQLPGHLHAVMRGSASQLLYGEFRDAKWSWIDFGDAILGEPAPELIIEGRMNIFYTAISGTTRQRAYYNGAWHDTIEIAGGTLVASGPSCAHWDAGNFELFSRTATGTLARNEYRAGYWASGYLDLGLPMPLESDPVVAQRTFGEGDLFVSTAAGQIWHVNWPRRP